MGTRKKYGSLQGISGNHQEKTNNFHLTKLPHTHPSQRPMKKYRDNPKIQNPFDYSIVIKQLILLKRVKK
jgi:hypothetical protein